MSDKTAAAAAVVAVESSNKSSGSSFSKLIQKALVIDIYGRPFEFKLPN